jgi:hypothetical protein
MPSNTVVYGDIYMTPKDLTDNKNKKNPIMALNKGLIQDSPAFQDFTPEARNFIDNYIGTYGIPEKYLGKPIEQIDLREVFLDHTLQEYRPEPRVFNLPHKRYRDV